MSERYVQKQVQWPHWSWVLESDTDKHRRVVGHIIGAAINVVILAFYLGLLLGYFLAR